jgi:hypothetical protein
VKKSKMELSIAADIRLTFRMQMQDEDAAQEMRPVVERIVRQVKQLVGLMAADDPSLKRLNTIASRLSAVVRGQEIRIQAEIAPEDFGAQDLPPPQPTQGGK